jgi:hypothetical protein
MLADLVKVLLTLVAKTSPGMLTRKKSDSYRSIKIKKLPAKNFRQSKKKLVRSFVSKKNLQKRKISKKDLTSLRMKPDARSKHTAKNTF